MTGKPGAEPGHCDGVLRQQALLSPQACGPEEIAPDEPGHAESEGTYVALALTLLPDHLLGRLDRNPALGATAVLDPTVELDHVVADAQVAPDSVAAQPQRELGLDLADVQLEQEEPGQRLGRVLGSWVGQIGGTPRGNDARKVGHQAQLSAEVCGSDAGATGRVTGSESTREPVLAGDVQGGPGRPRHREPVHDALPR
jgi:hypothetical protein